MSEKVKRQPYEIEREGKRVKDRERVRETEERQGENKISYVRGKSYCDERASSL